MKNKKPNHKKYKFTYIKTTLFTLFVCMLFTKGYTPFEKTGDNFFYITLNGQAVGTVGEKERAEELLIEARRNIASADEELVFMETDMEIAGEEVLWGKLDEESEMLRRMEEVLSGSVLQTMHRSYTIKVNEYMVNLASLEEAVALLQAAVDKYDSERKFQVELLYDNDREFSVLTTQITDTSQEQEKTPESYTSGGVENFFRMMDETEETVEEKDFEDYELGILNMDFSEDVEIVEVYLPESQLAQLSDAIDQVTKEEETASI